MPRVHISRRKGKSDAYRQAIFEGVYQALRETLNVPDDDQFMTITEHNATNLRYDATCLDIARSDDVIVTQIRATNSRTADQKKALFARLAELLGKAPGLRS